MPGALVRPGPDQDVGSRAARLTTGFRYRYHRGGIKNLLTYVCMPLHGHHTNDAYACLVAYIYSSPIGLLGVYLCLLGKGPGLRI